MQQFYAQLLKHYRFVYIIFPWTIVLKWFPTYWTAMPCLSILTFIELALKKKVNGELTRQDKRALRDLAIGWIVIYIILKFMDAI